MINSYIDYSYIHSIVMYYTAQYVQCGSSACRKLVFITIYKHNNNMVVNVIVLSERHMPYVNGVVGKIDKTERRVRCISTWVDRKTNRT